MKLQDFLPVENVIYGLKAYTKTQALRQLAQVAAQKSAVDSNVITEHLQDRERLG